ncbi:hypothetical protein WR25_17872 [Diploscapter pachys]|uniref:Uncharacterized protein n=1 Tax=Diploscapter pachys TaxID=2018661 RepID=A0A2A2M4Z8_9BILA|nr:hypothetical protein WR25_17872 [Diploscapter pachys]
MPGSVALRAPLDPDGSNPKLAIARNDAIRSASPQWISPPSATAKGAPVPKPRPAASIVPSDAAASTTTPTS